MPLTCDHEALGFIFKRLGQLVHSLKIFQDVNIWGKVHHVLFPTAIRHAHKLVQVVYGGAQNVT